eukprot:jgi/Tetstr1/446649/TSEL_034170.t1
MEAACHRQIECLVTTAAGAISSVESAEARGQAYVLRIQLCSEAVTWQVCFNSRGLPDIVFDDSGFQPLLVDYGKGAPVESIKASLRSWDVHTPTSLTKLTQQLLDAYQVYQLQRIQELRDERLVFEVDTVAACPGMHVLVVGNKVHLSIPLDVNALLEPLTASLRDEGVLPLDWDRQMQGLIRLNLSFTANGGAPSASVAFREPLKRWIGPVVLPAWSTEMCTVEFMERTVPAVSAACGAAAKSRAGRMNLLQALAAKFGTLLELDTFMASHSCHFMHCRGTPYLLHVRLSSKFPEVPPAVQLQRVDAQMAGCHRSNIPLADAAGGSKWSSFTQEHGVTSILQAIQDFLAG